MNENTALSIFNYHDNEVRTVILNNEIYFVVADICKVLEISNVSMAVGRLDQDGVSQAEVIDSLGRKQTAAIANEPNLYRLIFRSEKPEAKAFQDWVYKEVLPAIRKTGSYNPSSQLEGNALERIAQLERTVSSLVKQVQSPRKQQAETDTVDRRILAALILGERSLVYSDWQRECKQTLKISHATFNRYRKYLTEQGYVNKYRPEGQFVIHYCTHTPLQGQ